MSTLAQTDCAKLVKEFGLVDFVETGLFEGDGLRYAMTLGFRRYFSCDLVGAFINRGRAEFGGRDDVFLVHSGSPEFLRILPADVGPAFFWLDAHQPAAYDTRIVEDDENKFPVLRELEILRERPNIGRDVIMIDDLIAIVGSPRWHPGELSESMQVRSFRYEQLVEALEATHDPRLNLGMEGFLTLVPR